MDERPYSKREIDTMIAEIHKDVGDILGQTKKTNGRVTTLERWQYTIMGGLAILSMIVVPILGWALYTTVKLQQLL